MKACIIIALLCVAAFVAQLAWEPLTEMGVLVSAELLSRPWTLLTSMFLHGGVEHLLFNMLALVMFGIVLESIIGSKRFVLIYFSGGAVAGLAGALIYPAALGASGAIFAILGTVAVLRPRMVVWVSGIPMPMFVAAAVWMLVDLVGLFVPSGIANLAHIAGLLFGIAAGYFLRADFGEPFRRKKERLLSESEISEWEEKYML